MIIIVTGILIHYTTLRTVGSYYPKKVIEPEQVIRILKMLDSNLCYDPYRNVFTYDKTKITSNDIETAIEGTSAKR
jgi:hypothetical protein